MVIVTHQRKHEQLIPSNLKVSNLKGKELENKVKVFLELNEFDTSEYDERQLLKVMMKFLDEFMDSHPVLENIRSCHVDNIHY